MGEPPILTGWGGQGSAVSSQVGFAPADIDFGVFWEGQTHLTAIIIWIFVYRKIHTYVLYKIHIDNISVVLPLVTWLPHVLSACDVTYFTLSGKTTKRWRVEDSKYACTDLQEHVRRLHKGLENGSLLVGSWGRHPVGLGTKHKSSKTPRKQMQATYTMSERGHWTWGDRLESGEVGVYPIPAD